MAGFIIQDWETSNEESESLKHFPEVTRLQVEKPGLETGVRRGGRENR